MKQARIKNMLQSQQPCGRKTAPTKDAKATVPSETRSEASSGVEHKEQTARIEATTVPFARVSG
jgi:hypothetical protein